MSAACASRGSSRPPPSGVYRRAPESDAALVRGIQQFDRDTSSRRRAREKLFARHVPRMRALARRLLGSDQELDDVVQNAVLQALESIDSLVDPRAFPAWLNAITVHAVQRTIQRRRLLERLGLRRPLPIEQDLDSGPHVPGEVAADLRRVHATLARLPDEARMALLLRRVEGYTLAEIADLLGVSLSTVKRRLAQAEVAVNRHRMDD